MKSVLLLALIVGVVCLAEARDVRQKRGADMACPPPAPMVMAHAKFIKAARDAGLDIPGILSDMGMMQCPPTEEMQQMFKTLVAAAVAKGIPKPDYA